jgi:hypothetical protein
MLPYQDGDFFILYPVICPKIAKTRKIGTAENEILEYILMAATMGIGACIHTIHPNEKRLNFLRNKPKGKFNIKVTKDKRIIPCKCPIF